MPVSTAYTPLETLLLFQSLQAFGTDPPSFNRISDLLKSNELIREAPTFESGRLSAGALRELYVGLLKDELEEGTGVQNGDSRKRKAASPTTIQDLMKKPDYLPQLISRLYGRYRDAMIKEIREEERRYEDLARDVGEIERGEWDERIQREESGQEIKGAIKALKELQASDETVSKPKLPEGMAAIINSTSTTPRPTSHPLNRPQADPGTTGNVGRSRESLTHQPPASADSTSTESLGGRPEYAVQHIQTPVVPSNAPRTGSIGANNIPSLNINRPLASPADSHRQTVMPVTGNYQPQNQGRPPTGSSYPPPPLQLPYQAPLQGATLHYAQQSHQNTASPPRQQVTPNYYQNTFGLQPQLAGQPAGQNLQRQSLYLPTSAEMAAQPAQAQYKSPYQSTQPSVPPQPSYPPVPPTRPTLQRLPGTPVNRPGSPYTPLARRPPPIDTSSTRWKPSPASRPATLPPQPPVSPLSDSGSPVKKARPVKATGGLKRSRRLSTSTSRSQSVLSQIDDLVLSRIKPEPATPADESRKRKRTPDFDYPVPDMADSVPGPPPQTVYTARGFSKTTATILNEISRHRYSSLFTHPVKEKDAPGYHDLIYRPQDLKSIKAAITAGNRTVNEADAEEGWVPISEDVVPPKAIVNSAQLSKELMRMLANAIMYNPDPNRGFGPAFAKPEEQNEAHYLHDDAAVVKDVRALYVDVAKPIDNWRDIQRVPLRPVVENSANGDGEGAEEVQAGVEVEAEPGAGEEGQAAKRRKRV